MLLRFVLSYIKSLRRFLDKPKMDKTSKNEWLAQETRRYQHKKLYYLHSGIEPQTSCTETYVSTHSTTTKINILFTMRHSFIIFIL